MQLKEDTGQTSYVTAVHCLIGGHALLCLNSSALCYVITHSCVSLTWRVTLNDWMVVHLQSGIATAACEAYNMVLAVIHYDSRLIDGDVIRPHVEDDTDLSLILSRKKQQHRINATRNRTNHLYTHLNAQRELPSASGCRAKVVFMREKQIFCDTVSMAGFFSWVQHRCPLGRQLRFP